MAGSSDLCMAPKLVRIGNLAAMPELDVLVIDEAHHAVAATLYHISPVAFNAVRRLDAVFEISFISMAWTPKHVSSRTRRSARSSLT